jgi:plastocyanin
MLKGLIAHITHHGALVKARFAAVLIALCLLVAIVGFSSVLSGAIGLSPEGSASPPVTPGASPDDGPTTGTPGSLPVQPPTGTSVVPSRTTTADPTVYIEQDSTRLPATPAPSPSLPPSDPVATRTKSVPSATIETSTPALLETTRKVPSSGSDPSSISVNIRAEGEEYSPSKVTVPAGSRVTIVFENRDVDIPHNVIIYEDKAAPLFVGTIVKGPGKTTDTFTAPSTPGTFTLGCSFPTPHSKGTFIVE